MIDVKKAVRVSVAQLVELLADTAFVAKVAKCHIDAETVNLPTAKELVSLDPYLAVGVVLETVDGELFTVGYQKTSPVEADAWVKENVLPPIRQYELLSADEFKQVTALLVGGKFPLWAHCGYIVEGGLISATLDGDNNRFGRPYYLHDVATVLAIAGEATPESDEAYIKKYGLSNLMPVGVAHDPVYDSLVSAVVLSHALDRILVVVS